MIKKLILLKPLDSKVSVCNLRYLRNQQARQFISRMEI